ncbi:hypothetical protein ERO13_A08G010525v2 [Gossypium hirsutum]|nr:hypothetical protein ERO13_A08G010525v2 [Gossypium hirsutum]
MLEEDFWKSMFPNNPIPKDLKYILPSPVEVSNSEELSTKRKHGDENLGKTISAKGHQEVSIESDNITSINETTDIFEKDLRPGKLVNLPSLITAGDRTEFLADRVAKSVPFSSAKLPEILNHFSLKPQTREANTINETIRGCERAAIDGEQKFCASSLDSFINSSISVLGKEIQLLSTELSKETNNPLFTNSKGVQNMGETELVCHKKKYPRAVFLCHSIIKTPVYKVPLMGRDGQMVMLWRSVTKIHRVGTQSIWHFIVSKLSPELSPFVIS